MFSGHKLQSTFNLSSHQIFSNKQVFLSHMTPRDAPRKPQKRHFLQESNSHWATKLYVYQTTLIQNHPRGSSSKGQPLGETFKTVIYSKCTPPLGWQSSSKARPWVQRKVHVQVESSLRISAATSHRLSSPSLLALQGPQHLSGVLP